MPKGRPACRINVSSVRRRAGQARAAGRAAPPAVTGTRGVAVIHVQGAGQTAAFSHAQADALFQRVSDYFIENSYGALTATFTVHGVFTLPQPMSYYGSDREYELIADGLSLALSALVDFTPYDDIVILHAGRGQESSNVDTDVWSQNQFDGYTLSGKSFDGVAIVPEEGTSFDALGVTCHEYGHQLGLPDIYDTYTGRSTAGAWELMDYPYTGSPYGANPPHLGAWTRFYLGWTPAAFASTGTVVLPAASVSADGVRRLFATGTETFFGEYRRRDPGATYDNAIPREGIAVWHVDESIVGNPAVMENNVVNVPSYNGGGHKGVDLVESGGTESQPSNPGKVWVNGEGVAPPATDLFAGGPSLMSLTGIAGVGSATASGELAFFQSAAGAPFIRGVSYPNPAGGGRAPRPGAPPGTVATVRLEFAGFVSSSSLGLDLFSFNGSRLRSVQGFNLRAEPISGDYEWVYEFDWDGRDEAGEEVAAGAYYYEARGNGHEVKGTLLLVR